MSLDVAATVAEIEQKLGRKATPDDVELTTLALAAIGRTISAGEFSTALRSWGLASRSMGAFFEDVDLSRRLRRAGWKLAVVDGARAYHVKGGSHRDRRGEVEYRRAQLAYYAKHRPPWENRFLRFKLRRKFARLADPEERRQLLALLDG